MTELKDISANFSNKQKKLVEKIKLLVGEKVAIALVSMQGVNGTSQAEIEVVANIIGIFDKLEINKLIDSPRSIVIQGIYLKDYFVEIKPQYKVATYSIDLAIFLYCKDNKIASVGIEYDGHISHYVESNIKKAYKRDLTVLSNSDLPLIKISPEQKKNISDITKNIKKYFKHKIRDFKKFKKSLLRNFVSKHLTKLVNECPVCEGVGSLANNFCPECEGVGRIEKRKIDLSRYSSFDCPECMGNSTNCKTCIGKGWINRDAAVQWQKKHYENT